MINTLFFDFAQVLCFPKASTSTLAEAYRRSQEGEAKPEDLFELNSELIEFVKNVGTQYRAHIFSATDPAVLESLKPHLTPPFERFFSARNLSLDKTDPAAYRFLAQDVAKKPTELLFIDDNFFNVEAAQQAGWQGIVFETTRQFIADFHRLV